MTNRLRVIQDHTPLMHPEGVKYRPVNRTYITYVNRRGLRKAVFRAGEQTSMSTDNTVQSWAPFVRVEDK